MEVRKEKLSKGASSVQPGVCQQRCHRRLSVECICRELSHGGCQDVCQKKRKKNKRNQRVDEKDCRVTSLFQLAQNDPCFGFKKSLVPEKLSVLGTLEW